MAFSISKFQSSVLSDLEWDVVRQGPHARWRARLSSINRQYRFDGPVVSLGGPITDRRRQGSEPVWPVWLSKCFCF